MEVVEKLSTLQSFKVYDVTNENKIYVFHLNLLDFNLGKYTTKIKRDNDIVNTCYTTYSSIGLLRFHC